MPITLEQRPVVSAGDVEMVGIDYTDWLDSGELLTGTPTVAEVTTTDLTLSNKAVNSTAVTILGTSVAVGKAVQFKMSGQSAGKTYRVRVTVSTDATPARTAVRDVLIRTET